MDLPEKSKKKSFLTSCSHAVNGLLLAIRTESHLKVHFIITILVLLLGFLLGLSLTEWLFIVLAIGLVIGFELLNTAIETVVDLTVGNHYHDLAKKAKDIAAGAVLFVAIISAILGVIVFGRHLF